MPAEPPPLSTPWSLNPTPDILDDLIIETVDSENAPGSYTRLPPGTPHPDQEKYPNYLFVAQKTIAQNKVQRYWSTTYHNQDVYNYDIDFVSDSKDHPVYVRRYLTRRDQYVDIARGAMGVLTGIWMIRVTDGGSGYDSENPPTVTITSASGSGATAVALVNPDGTVDWIRITNEGSGYLLASVTIAAPTAGVTATAEAVLQSVSCVLVKQTVNQLPQDDPRYSLFVIESRQYQTFPGPYLDRWDYEARIEKYVKIRKRLILSSTVPADPNAVTLAEGTTIEYQDITDVYTAEITTVVPTSIAWENGGEDFVYSGFVNHRFPDQINIEDVPTIVVVSALTGTAIAADYAWDIKVKEGYSGPCRATITERYTFDPTDAAFIAALPIPTSVFPKAETIWVYIYGSSGDNPFAQVRSFPVPMTLHPAFEVEILEKGSFTGYNRDFKPTISATNPTGFHAGDTMTLVSEPQRLGIGGLWVCRIIEIVHPNPEA